jgi:hypothetical protein
MTKTFFLITILTFLGLSLAAPDVSAQKKKRIAFKKGYAEISGTIKGEQTLEYVFRAKKNADIDMSVDNDKFENSIYPKFVLIKPNGKPFYEKGSVNYGIGTDMMETLSQAGDYTIQLQLPEDMRNDGKPVKFTLRIILK